MYLFSDKIRVFVSIGYLLVMLGCCGNVIFWD